ncbi:SGNH/GDSL hydrolase family protein [Pseudobutyrivibrio xylanivorans]|uniref:SGNH/GDSL hydrolase family protein n=1 Tax=Pseudobutyrivibrio xylanivorans TaxID=185007 RepID=A0A1G5RWX8_PSEXY|nr:SGNH/GDSL hydrolase family protein [Pseudobutyrivibrio xylanivorans]SCZ78622.1 hypothetical protein SAMN02910350_01364 [Pseudobutyrivibrio xylanivorans]
MRKTIIRISGFLLILVFALGYYKSIFSFKSADGIGQMEQFYNQPENSIDVLVLGSSHAFVNFNNGTLYDEYGIASYNLGATTQPIWNTYYYLKEALKTQTPELIVLEGYMLGYDKKYLDDPLNFKNFCGMKWSENKIEAIKTGTPPQRVQDFIMEYPVYHTRYSSLQKGDFLDDFGSESRDYNWFNEDWKGQYLFNTAAPQVYHDLSVIDYKKELFPKTEKYYRKILELAQEKDIPVLIVITPFDLLDDLEKYQARYNRAEEIAEEYDVTFLNFQTRLEELGLDLNSDYRDACHLTVWGSVKYSRYIGNYIKEHYKISDRRGDSKYISWANNAAYTNRYYIDSLLKYQTSLADISNRIEDPNYWVIISTAGKCDTSDTQIRSFLEQQGITETDSQGIWLKQDGKLTWTSCDGDSKIYVSNDYRDFRLMYDKESDKTGTDANTDSVTNNCVIDNTIYNDKVKNGLNVTIYDSQINIVIDDFGVNKDDNYSIVR